VYSREHCWKPSCSFNFAVALYVYQIVCKCVYLLRRCSILRKCNKNAIWLPYAILDLFWDRKNFVMIGIWMFEGNVRNIIHNRRGKTRHHSAQKARNGAFWVTPFTITFRQQGHCSKKLLSWITLVEVPKCKKNYTILYYYSWYSLVPTFDSGTYFSIIKTHFYSHKRHNRRTIVYYVFCV